MKLLSTGNPKILKGEKQGYMTYILHLAPADVSGYNTCPKATAGCKAACLNTAGRGGMFKRGESTNVIQEARKRKTRFFFENRGAFLAILKDDIRKAIKQAEKKGLIPVFRLNGTSDIAWEKYGVIQEFPNVQFYDYTAILGRKVSNLTNYHLTFSKKESNDMDVRLAASNGMNVAVVFSTKKGKEMPSKYIGRQVFNGDDSDLRFLDPKGVVVGLYAKGKAKKDFSGFVVQV
jgi:hypothetical protein